MSMWVKLYIMFIEHHRGRPGGGWDDNEESRTTGTLSHRQNRLEITQLICTCI